MRHFSDPHPQRWYAYLDDDTEPMNDGSGNVRLSEAVAWAERHDLVGPRVEIQ